MTHDRLLLPTLLAAAAALLASCEMHDYETGDGELSMLTAEFIEAHADGNKVIDLITTDEGQLLTLSEPATYDWIIKGDSTYRALLYYIPLSGDGAGNVVKEYSLQQVTTLKPVDQTRMKEQMATDPVSLESIWMSTSGRYINIGLQIKSGAPPTEEASHKLAMIMTGTSPQTLTLFHDRGEMPENYTRRFYFSLPTDQLAPGEVTIRVNTYDGVTEKVFRVGE